MIILNTILKTSLVLLCLFIFTQQTCHYSCLNCTSSSYTTCFSCSSSANSLTVLQDPAKIDPAYRHSIYSSGACTATVPSQANILGIILLVVSVGGLLLTQSYQAFYICSTLQTLALFGLLQIAWLQPSSFILQAFQYFMPINIILSSSKTDDPSLFLFGFYRLDAYMISSQNIGLIAVFGIDCALFLAIVLVFALTLCKKKNQMAKDLQSPTKKEQGHNLVPEFSNKSQKQLQKNQFNKLDQISKLNNEAGPGPQTGNENKLSKCAKMKQVFVDKFLQCFILRKIMHLLIYLFFFFTQETVLSIMVGAVFTIDILDIAIWIVYFIQIVTVVIISFYQHSVDQKLDATKSQKHQYGLSLFVSRQCLFIVLVKKVILPLGIVLPLEIQYFYFVMYLILFLIQGSLDAKSGRVTCLSRITLWKLFQVAVTTLVLTFFFNQRNGSQQSGANAVSIILTITLAVFMISLVCEFVISFVALFFGITKVQNQFEAQKISQNNLQLNNTEQTINQYDHNIFETIQITRQDLKKQQFAEKNKVDIVDIDDNQNDFIDQKYKDRNILVISNTKTVKQEKVQNKSIDQDKKFKIVQPVAIFNKIEKQAHIERENTKDTLSNKRDKTKGIQSEQKKVSSFLEGNQNKTIDTYVQDFDHQQNPDNDQKNNHDDDHDENQQAISNQNDNKQKRQKKKRRILDPQLRKRYGMK